MLTNCNSKTLHTTLNNVTYYVYLSQVTFLQNEYFNFLCSLYLFYFYTFT